MGGHLALWSLLTPEQVWDGFVTLALLNDCQQWSKVLEVPHIGDKRIVSPVPFMLGIVASMSMANPNYATIVKSVYGSMKMVTRSGLLLLMELQWDVHAVQSTIARYLLKTTNITSVLTTLLKTWSVQLSAVILP